MANIFFGEFIGTLLLVLLGNGVVANVLLKKSKGEKSGWIVISSGWGFAVAVAVYVSAWLSGGHLNPAITLGFIIAGITDPSLFGVYLAGQMTGAILGATLVWLSYYPHFRATPEPDLKLLCFSTKPAIDSPFWNFLCEVIGTAVLLLGVLGIFNIHNGISGGMGPYAVGILIFSIGLSLGGPTGYAINPARDLGPRIAHALLPMRNKGSSHWDYAWIPIVGPLVGAVLGTLIYQLFIAGRPPL